MTDVQRMNTVKQRESTVIVAWLCIYLIIAGFLSLIFTAIRLIKVLAPSTPFIDQAILIFGIGVPFLLMGIGVVSALPLSEYYYMREAGRNPAIAREAIAHSKRQPERRELGVLLGAAGITFLLQVSPWDLFVQAFAQFLGLVLIVPIMLGILLSLVAFYRIRMRGMAKFE